MKYQDSYVDDLTDQNNLINIIMKYTLYYIKILYTILFVLNVNLQFNIISKLFLFTKYYIFINMILFYQI